MVFHQIIHLTTRQSQQALLLMTMGEDKPSPQKPSRVRPGASSPNVQSTCVGEDVSVLGSDLRLAPFGAGRRVCPGKAMGLATVHLWLAQLLQSYKWVPTEGGVDLSECLKMSLEMEKPLACKAVPRW
uniref:Uncharacterized protein n=1 Tax=Musa acuminata subsp. malaccensis TaxID=214687 RepID=A0A804HVE6_MUSAM|nr:PREDICTED: cytochrome P450 78A5-like [Musa acuminata subsp. malaccensis]